MWHFGDPATKLQDKTIIYYFLNTQMKLLVGRKFISNDTHVK